MRLEQLLDDIRLHQQYMGGKGSEDGGADVEGSGEVDDLKNAL